MLLSRQKDLYLTVKKRIEIKLTAGIIIGKTKKKRSKLLKKKKSKRWQK